MQLPTIQFQWLSFSFLTICFAVAVPVASADEQRLLVTSDDAKIQSGNDVLARVQRGERLRSTKRDGDWYLVHVPNSTERGWIHRRFVEVARPATDPPKPGREIPRWGTAYDPDGDCSIRQSDGKLTITVAKGVHDHWYGRKDAAQRFNAPRVLQAVKGDFVAQVKVTADWSGEKIEAGYWSLAAGLIVRESDLHYFRVERNQYFNRSVWSWVPPIYDHNKTRVTKWRAYNDGRPFEGRSTWLRIERSGQTLTSAMSHDGQEWSRTGRLETKFPERVQVGVVAISASSEDFVVEFEDFSITQR